MMVAPSHICSACRTPVPLDAAFCSSCGAPTPTQITEAFGDDFADRLATALADRYHVVRELGRGGMAVVYLADDIRHERQVALKVMRPDVADAIGHDRFGREIKLAAKLNHPHILALHDSGEASGFLYYVMPFVEGESLRDRLRRERQLPIEEALRIARQIAEGLDHAHELGVIHRDIKPENILLTRDRALIADFGIGKALATAGGTNLTSTGTSIGTPLYMSPEQAGGDPGIDHRTDIYSLGCVLYELLAGEPPFTGPTRQAIMAKHALEPRPSVRVVRGTVSGGIEQEIKRAMAVSPADRHATAGVFAETLLRAGAGMADAQGQTGHHRGARSWRAWRLRLAGFAVVTVASILALQQYWPRGGEEGDTSVVGAAGMDSGRAVAAPRDSNASRPDSVAVTRIPESPAPATPPPGVAHSAPRAGYVSIDAQPWGTVYIDGLRIQETPLMTFEVEPGRHIISIERAGYLTLEDTVVVRAGDTVKRSRILRRQ